MARRRPVEMRIVDDRARLLVTTALDGVWLSSQCISSSVLASTGVGVAMPARGRVDASFSVSTGRPAHNAPTSTATPTTSASTVNTVDGLAPRACRWGVLPVVAAGGVAGAQVMLRTNRWYQSPDASKPASRQ